MLPVVVGVLASSIPPMDAAESLSAVAASATTATNRVNAAAAERRRMFERLHLSQPGPFAPAETVDFDPRQ